MVSALALATVACGDDDETSATNSTSTTGGGGMGSGGMGSGGDGTGGMGTGGMGTGGMGSGGMGSGGDGSGGMGETPIHGCTSATAMDMTGQATVDLNWVMSFSSCIIVDANTTVNWNGNFVAHPLAGGVSPTSDAASPITMSDQGGATASVTFSTAGVFPYFCAIHTGTMQGVVYVQ